MQLIIDKSTQQFSRHLNSDCKLKRVIKQFRLKKVQQEVTFCIETKEILQGWLRSGDSYISNGVVEFAKQLLPCGRRTLFWGYRSGESGFLCFHTVAAIFFGAI